MCTKENDKASLETDVHFVRASKLNHSPERYICNKIIPIHFDILLCSTLLSSFLLVHCIIKFLYSKNIFSRNCRAV